jgi:hypothetical protein
MIRSTAARRARSRGGRPPVDAASLAAFRIIAAW